MTVKKDQESKEKEKHPVLYGTSFGTVAENRSVCLSFGKAAMILSISLRNPMSNNRSASSNTSTFTSFSRPLNPAVFSMWSLSLPGVAISICKSNFYVVSMEFKKYETKTKESF